jgi:hypothetical protein
MTTVSVFGGSPLIESSLGVYVSTEETRVATLIGTLATGATWEGVPEEVHALSASDSFTAVSQLNQVGECEKKEIKPIKNETFNNFHCYGEEILHLFPCNGPCALSL